MISGAGSTDISVRSSRLSKLSRGATAGRFAGRRARTRRDRLLPKNRAKEVNFIDINLAFSRTPGQPKRYVQDLIHERAVDLVPLLSDANSHFYVCGLKAMEEGVVLALRDVAIDAGLDWDGAIGPSFKREGRLHLETY